MYGAAICHMGANTRIGLPYAYGASKFSMHVWAVPYVYWTKYAYGL